ncbi:MAG TPA: ATP-dependent RecD-like DNA helicase [Polyangiales bacterium]|jgi:exodeoxyribonuclease V alpha subunit|nr:ATP-dependent RecD-like DNA helicase [Polyangiales bacterium]
MPLDETTLTVTVDELVYRSADSRFSVLSATREDRDEKVVLVGDLRESAPGETLRIHGRFEEHRTFGRRFRVQTYTPVTPTTALGIARYLGSGLINGIGPEIAKRLVAHFGERTLDVITTQSARLREVPGIGPARADSIAGAVRSRQAEAELFSFLQSLGLGPAGARRIAQKYGERSASVVREDPYLVAEQVAGIGFRTADAMASALGYARDDPRRAAGAVLHLLGRGADEGHTYLTQPELLAGARELDVPEARMPAALQELAQRELIVLDEQRVYAPPLLRAEQAVAKRLRALAAPRTLPTGLEDALRAAIPEHFAAAQRDAVRASFETGVLVLTGGPGTGKTTTTQAIVQAQRAVGRRVLLCAPTGRAAKRLTEATGAEAQTIHRLLEWNPMSGSFARNQSAPLETDFVLVDEASMLDVQLTERLLAALPREATLLLVGDVDQLPPIGAGPVLRELIESGACPVVRLREVFRQAQESAIVRAAHSILGGHRPTPTAPGSRGSGDLFVVRASDPHAIHARLTETLDRMRAVYHFDPLRDVQVLTPMRRGPLGTEALNQLLQQHLNPSRDALVTSSAFALTSPSAPPARRFRTGDKIMQLKNDYDREVWNGDLGEVTRLDAGITYARMGNRDVSYEPDALDAISLAYACTVHKVQGSEFPAVVIVLHSSHHVLLTRALLYTAVTRARKLAVILGDDRALSRAIANVDQRKVNTHLRARLS